MAKSIEVIVNSHLWLLKDETPEPLLRLLVQRLTINNKAKEAAVERMLPDTDQMPDEIELWEETDECLILPRGFASRLMDICDNLQLEVSWQDQRTRKTGFYFGESIPARPYQYKIIDAVMKLEQGIVQAPTGSGKTVAALEIMRLTPPKSIVIVNTKEIADQWLNRAAEWLGKSLPTSMIGDGIWDDSGRIVVAIQASLWSRREQLLEDGFFDQFTTAVMDECHHANADTYRFIFSQFNSQFRFGMSATPKKTGDFRVARAVLGDIIVEVTEKDVRSQIIKPRVEVITTKFGAKFKGDKEMAGGWVRRNNYQTVLKKLVHNSQRNELIAEEIVGNHYDCANLVLSKRIDHLSALYEALAAAGYPEDQMFALYGDQKTHERREVIDRVNQGECVILSTLADEALDAPRLDRLHIAFPTKNADLIKQQIGRIRRKHPDKKDAIVIDYRDMQVPPMEKQYMIRRHEVYNPMGFEVVKRKV